MEKNLHRQPLSLSWNSRPYHDTNICNGTKRQSVAELYSNTIVPFLLLFLVWINLYDQVCSNNGLRQSNLNSWKFANVPQSMCTIQNKISPICRTSNALVLDFLFLKKIHFLGKQRNENYCRSTLNPPAKNIHSKWGVKSWMFLDESHREISNTLPCSFCWKYCLFVSYYYNLSLCPGSFAGKNKYIGIARKYQIILWQLQDGNQFQWKYNWLSMDVECNIFDNRASLYRGGEKWCF